MQRNDMTRETLQFFKDADKSVHITLIDGKWLNGTITTISDDRFILHEEKYGEMLIFLERVSDNGITERKGGGF